eukprot:3472236-Amphidinium_carterae.1
MPMGINAGLSYGTRPHNPGNPKLVLAALYQRCKSDSALVLPLTLAQYSKAIQDASCATGLQKLRILPYTVRHGGPSVDAFLHARELPQIQERGQWRCAKTVSRYKKTGRLARQLALMGPALLDEAHSARDFLERHLAKELRQWKA